MGWMEEIDRLLAIGVGYVWNTPLVVSLIGMGVFATFALGGIQIRGFRHAIDVVRGRYDDPHDPGEITHFQALTTALSATVGLGNIAGVAVAVHVGGPGATFWMIVAGLAGMATKYSECTLAQIYRKVDRKGVVHGGPMYYIRDGIKEKSPALAKGLAGYFAIACILASFGSANMFQTNQVAAIFKSTFNISPLITGLTLGIATGIVIIGGIKRIGKVTSFLVPFMGGIYFFGALAVIFMNIADVPGLLFRIVHDAFSGTAAVGGATGIALRTVLIQGVRRASFSNEAGMGSAAIAHAAAATKEPVREGVVALLEPFIDTVVVCTMTALVILISGAWTQDANGVELTALAFDSAIPGFGSIFVPIAVFLFAFSTLLSWSYYGERATDYLFGEKGILAYKIVFCVLAVMGAVWKIDPVLNFSDLVFGLMAVPNLIAIAILFPKLKKETNKYFAKVKDGTYVKQPKKTRKKKAKKKAGARR